MPHSPNSFRARIRRLVMAVRCRMRGAREIRAIIARCPPARDGMAEFGRLTDQQFTALAKNLGGLNEQFGVMKRELEVLDDVLHDRDQTHAVGAARALCKNSIELVHASLGVAHTIREQMARVDAGLQRTCAMREDFDKSFLLLRTVAMGFRVEAARVDSEFQGVFANVAAAISDIDHRIAASTRGAFAQIDQLLAESAEERMTVTTGEAGSFAGAQAAIDAVRHDLDALQAALAPISQATEQIAAEVDKSGPVVLQVLQALQYQDIVRQRLEHVSEGLADIEQAAQRAAGHECRELAYFGHAARIQLSQLESARSEIGRAGDEVTRGLCGLRDLGRAILGQLNELETRSGHALGSEAMVAMFTREIGHLARIAEASEHASRRVASLVERIGSVITVFSEEIEKQVREVKLVALNAQVAAARLPCAGALEKLAEETTHISRANATISHGLARSLRETLECLKGIRAEADEFLVAVGAEKAIIERGAGEIGDALRHHTDDVRRMSAQVRQHFDHVQQQLEQTLGGIDFSGQIDACFAPAEALCRELEEQAGEDVLETIPQDGRLESHAARYTMEKERETHRSTATPMLAPAGTDETKGASVHPGEAAPATLPAASASCGEMELF